MRTFQQHAVESTDLLRVLLCIDSWKGDGSMREHYNRVWADVNLDAIRSNIRAIQGNLKNTTKSCVVIKADGYGHGAVHVAQNVEDLVDFFAVATFDEGMELRSAGIGKPVLVLGYVHPSLSAAAARNEIRLTVYDMDNARKISEYAGRENTRAVVHIKVDTGMGRIGFMPEEKAADIVAEIGELKGISIEGLFTHFANADAETPEYAMKQLKLFQDFSQMLQDRGILIPIRHCSNSAAATYLREADMDMVRMGISVYGLYPSAFVRQIPLQPALSLKSHVIMVKTVPAGTCVGYGSTWQAKRESRIATISVGYADGYSRSLSNKGYILIRGEQFPVIGRVCMDQIMADVTERPDVTEGDEVVLIGSSGAQCITAEEIADLSGSFNYEFVCGFGRRVPRKYYRNGKLIGIRNVFDMYYEDGPG